MKKYILSILAIILCLGCKKATQSTQVTSPVSLEAQLIMTPEYILAAESIDILAELSSFEFDQDTFQLQLNSTLGTRVYKGIADQDKVSFSIPAEENNRACKVWLKLVYKSQVITRDYFNILPQVASDKITSYNGPKTLFAQDDDVSMNISIPHDRYGNPLIPNSVVNYSSSFNGRSSQQEKALVDHLLAYKLTSSKAKKGKMLIGASSYEGYSREQELIIGPVMPTDYQIEIIKYYPFADSRQFIHLRSDILKDKLGNIVADGTLIYFAVFEKGELIGSYQAFTISGVANVFIENPAKASIWKVQSIVWGSAKSNILNLEFKKNVKTFKLSYDSSSQRILIGPVFGNLGQLVPDGSKASIRIQDQQLESEVYLESGKANFKLPIAWNILFPAEVSVTIGGQNQKLMVNDK